MAVETMSEEAYLRARGWERSVTWDDQENPWTCERFLNEYDHVRGFSLAEAVEAQLAEDRAALAFVFSRSVFRATYPDGTGLTVDLTGATIEAAAKGGA